MHRPRIRPRTATSSPRSSTAGRSRGTRPRASSVPNRRTSPRKLAGLEVPGLQAPQAPSSPQASDSNGGKGFQWHWWWWLLAVVPVLVLVGLVAFAALRNRRRRGDDERAGPSDGGLGGESPRMFSGAAAADQAGTGDRSLRRAVSAIDYGRGGLGVPCRLRLPGQRIVSGRADQPVGLVRGLSTKPLRPSRSRRRPPTATNASSNTTTDATTSTTTPIPVDTAPDARCRRQSNATR